MVLKVTVSPDLIAGDVDEGYGKVADVFRRNLTSGQEVGAAVAVYRDGVKVVDLWGGFRNGITKAPWEEDTLTLMFSTTKGVSALTVAVAASQGLISYDARVADYWPEFAQAWKGASTVRQLLSHPAGLPPQHDQRNVSRQSRGHEFFREAGGEVLHNNAQPFPRRRGCRGRPRPSHRWRRIRARSRCMHLPRRQNGSTCGLLGHAMFERVYGTK